MRPADDPFRLRAATAADVPALEALIARSVRGLSAGYYSPEQAESGLRYVFGVDSQLLADGTYFVVEHEEGALVACGGWSARRTHFGGDQMKQGDDPRLDPAVEAARIRAFFVDPAWARRGLGRRLLERCAAAAAAAGFRALELVATLPGEPLYAALGFTVQERFAVPLPDGVTLPVARMRRPVDAGPPATARTSGAPASYGGA